MAEVTGLRNNALPYPVYGAPFGVVFPILDADGDFVTSAASLDSERSLNGDTFADCTNEATEIGATGVYYLLLTQEEMTADVVVVQVKTGTAGAKTTPIVLHPRKLVSLRAGTAAGGASDSITLDSGASAVDDYYNGCLVVAELDCLPFEARIVTDYVGSTKVASVTPSWNTTPDSDDLFTIYLPEGRQITQSDPVAFGGTAGTFSSGRPEVNTTHFGGSALTQSSGRPEVNTTHAAGTAWGSGAITAAAIATDAIDADAIADNAITAGAIASGAITADKLASDAITDAKVASDVTIASVTGAVGSVTGNVGGNVTGSVGSLATQAKADVNAEVLDVLVTDTFAQPGQGAPAATNSIKNMLAYLFKAWRNKITQTSTQYSLYADDESTIDQKASVVDDGTTFTKGEVATGP